ncbi:MAG: hypothetical protein KR126chlam6_00598 [Candidatus Anoxychlamydiales bacterium]|nr:hypothetical protein [Candidatus Anoxychlamydiales bacterium]
MIFAITTNTLVKKRSSDHFIAKSFSGFMTSNRNALNQYEKYNFDQIKKVAEKKENVRAYNQNNTAEKKPRVIKPENAKLNIASLICYSKNSEKTLYKFTTSLIKTLYSNQSFYIEGFENYMLDNILIAFENQQDKNQELNFETLIFKEDSLQKIFYKMLKGTKFYDYDKNIGIASFLDFVKIENNSLDVLIKDASKEFLVTLFNKEIFQEINILQKEKGCPNLTYENVLNICSNHHFNVDKKLLHLFTFSNFSSRHSNEKVLVGYDKNTDIKFKIKVPSN